MSHPVNDQIVDNAIDTVADMNDARVVANLVERGVVINEYLDSDTLRDMLTDMVCDDLMARPGPHG